jgi:hypothetical protein
MNRAQESALVWALADCASAHLHQQARARLCVKIGAGEQEGVMMDLLQWYARNNIELPSGLADGVRSWIGGYSGSDYEPLLRSLLDRIHVSDGNGTGEATKTAAADCRGPSLQLAPGRRAKGAH